MALTISATPRANIARMRMTRIIAAPQRLRRVRASAFRVQPTCHRRSFRTDCVAGDDNRVPDRSWLAASRRASQIAPCDQCVGFKLSAFLGTRQASDPMLKARCFVAKQGDREGTGDLGAHVTASRSHSRSRDCEQRFPGTAPVTRTHVRRHHGSVPPRPRRCRVA
jgi:hypothetical protein